MKNNIVRVSLWGNDICLLEWEGGYRNGFGKVGAQVTFSRAYLSTPYDVDPIGPYKRSSYIVTKGLSDYLRAKDNDGLPRFLSGALPDDWGNKVFSLWISKNGLRSHDVTPIDKLAFIGKRGMGAFEFMPQLYNADADNNIAIDELYALSRDIEQSRAETIMNFADKPGIGDLMAVGMSAGGAHPKAIIAIDWNTGEIRSGQIDLPANFTHYLLKFKNSEALLAPEIEYVYYLLAKECKIEMTECRLLSAGGTRHFLTERFDRKNGKKIHAATLHALAGEVYSYEEIFHACRMLQLPYHDIEQLYRRAVFNYLAGVCDDHDKNFSFIMNRDGKWRLSPAYDETFSVNIRNPLRHDRHSMTIEESNYHISRDSFVRLAKENDVRNPETIIEEIVDTLHSFSKKAEENDVEPAVARYIASYMNSQMELV